MCMRRIPVLGSAVAAVAACLALSACSASSGTPVASGTAPAATTGAASAPAPAPSASGSAAAPASTPAAPASSPASVPVSAPAGPAACTGHQITVGHGRGDGAAGHLAVVLTFTNWTGTPCTLHGYPGVAGLDAADRQVVQARRTLRGMMGGAAPGATHAPTILVPAHGVVSARVEAGDVPQGGATACPTYAGLLVTPPGTRTSTRLVADVQLPGCAGLEVHPVVPGTTGDQG